jgi:transcriptional regulator with XRE-family HTH domain
MTSAEATPANQSLKGKRMEIANRLRALREERKLSQGHVEERTGLKRCYTSRVENGYTVPSLKTLEKYADAFNVPLFKLFYDANKPPPLLNLFKRSAIEELTQGDSSSEDHYLSRLFKSLRSMNQADRSMFLHVTQKVASRQEAK